MTAPEPPQFTRSDVIATGAGIAAVFGMPVLGFCAAWWAAGFVPDLASGYAIPAQDRRGVELPPPPTSYWIIWAAPPLTVAALGGAAMLVASRTRWVTFIGVLAFLLGYLPYAYLVVSIDIGGFAPT
ncbi:hypothetical protein HQ607_18800 [Rhodococcus corynebacterioides]|nr:hypothetical protein [Rhodococcus corynebacterioides]